MGDINMSHGQKSLYWGWSSNFNRESLQWGPINPYGLGLMSLSPIIWTYRFHHPPFKKICILGQLKGDLPGTPKDMGTPLLW